MIAAGFSLQEWQIRLLLPHRAPVLQLDRVDACSAALDSLDASKAVGGSDPMIMRSPRMPAHLAPAALIEAMAQCCGLLVRLRWLANAGIDVAAFAAGDTEQINRRVIPRSVLVESQARFERLATPGQVLRLATRLVLSRGEMHRFEASVYTDSKAVAAQIMLNFPRPDDVRRDAVKTV